MQHLLLSGDRFFLFMSTGVSVSFCVGIPLPLLKLLLIGFLSVNRSLISFIESSDVGTLLNVPMVSSRDLPLPVSDASSFEPSLVVDFVNP